MEDTHPTATSIAVALRTRTPIAQACPQPATAMLPSALHFSPVDTKVAAPLQHPTGIVNGSLLYLVNLALQPPLSLLPPKLGSVASPLPRYCYPKANAVYDVSLSLGHESSIDMHAPGRSATVWWRVSMIGPWHHPSVSPMLNCNQQIYAWSLNIHYLILHLRVATLKRSCRTGVALCTFTSSS